MTNIGMVGNGMAGFTADYAIILRAVGCKTVLVDKDKKRFIVESDDLLHAMPLG